MNDRIPLFVENKDENVYNIVVESTSYEDICFTVLHENNWI